MFFIIFLLLIAIAIIFVGLYFFIIDIARRKKEALRKETQINIDEFDDVENMKHQKIEDKKTMERELEKLSHVYDDFGGINNLLNYADNRANMDTSKKQASRYLNSYYKNKPGEIYEKEVLDGPCVSELKDNGYDFDVELFKKWSKQIFGCIKSGTKDQLKIVKNFISEILYSKFIQQLEVFEEDGLEFVTEDLIIEKCNLYDYSRSMSKEEIKVLIVASMKEYIIEKSTKKIMRGTNKKSYKKKIFMTFTKKNTNDEEGLIHNCPNCGAEISQTEFGKCSYCNTLLIPIRYNWTLTKFETMH